MGRHTHTGKRRKLNRKKVMIGEPTASIRRSPASGLVDLPAAGSFAAALLPLFKDRTTPKRPRSEEPTAFATPQVVATLLPPAPKL